MSLRMAMKDQHHKRGHPKSTAPPVYRRAKIARWAIKSCCNAMYGRNRSNKWEGVKKSKLFVDVWGIQDWHNESQMNHNWITNESQMNHNGPSVEILAQTQVAFQEPPMSTVPRCANQKNNPSVRIPRDSPIRACMRRSKMQYGKTLRLGKVDWESTCQS